MSFIRPGIFRSCLCPIFFLRLELGSSHSALYITWADFSIFFLFVFDVFWIIFYLPFLLLYLICCQIYYIFIYVVISIYRNFVFSISAMHFLYFAPKMLSSLICSNHLFCLSPVFRNPSIWYWYGSGYAFCILCCCLLIVLFFPSGFCYL